MFQAWWTSTNHIKSWIASEDHALNLMDNKGVHFELLSSNWTINSNVYCQQLMKLEGAIKEKRTELANHKRISFHHDNASHIFTNTCKITGDWLGSDVTPPIYSLDFASSDYHLFWSLQNFLNGKNFSNNNDLNHT